MSAVLGWAAMGGGIFTLGALFGGWLENHRQKQGRKLDEVLRLLPPSE